jgi:hypothetical protein
MSTVINDEKVELITVSSLLFTTVMMRHAALFGTSNFTPFLFSELRLRVLFPLQQRQDPVWERIYCLRCSLGGSTGRNAEAK